MIYSDITQIHTCCLIGQFKVHLIFDLSSFVKPNKKFVRLLKGNSSNPSLRETYCRIFILANVGDTRKQNKKHSAHVYVLLKDPKQLGEQRVIISHV